MENPSTNPSLDSKLHFLDYWRIIRIRKTVILAVFLLVVLTTTIVTYWLPKYYRSTVRISVEKDASDIAGLFDLRQSPTGYDPYWLQTQFEKIQGKTVLYAVISNLNLNVKWGPRFNAGAPLTVNETFGIVRRLLDVRQSRNTSLIEIHVLDEDANEAALIANTVAETYKETRLRQRKDAAMGGIRVLEERLKAQEVKMEQAQSNVARLREQYDISDAAVDSGQTSPLEVETVRRLELERIQALTVYSQLHSQLTNLTSLDRSTLRKALPTAIPDTLLTSLLSDYAKTKQEITLLSRELGAQNPQLQKYNDMLQEIDRQIEAKLDGVLVGLANRVNALKSEYDVRTRELEEAQKRDRENAKKYGPYLLAKRKMESERSILHAMNLKSIAEDVEVRLPKTSIVEVVDPAEPGMRPVRPNITLNIALGVIVGLIVGFGLAFFIEYLDTSVKTIDDVERSLQAPVLGVIPQNVGYLLEEGPDSPHAEAYRVLRTNLLFSRKDNRWNTITVVSGGAGEGKSTTVFNLATVFAQNGQRVLVVDSDLRRPSLHKFLHVSNSLGLTNYLLKQKNLEEVIQTTKVPMLDFLPSGKLPSSSLGILNSARMKEFISEVKQRYEFVFFDSPPIMGVSDASVLASEVDMTLLVVQYRKYPQLMTVRAKQMVEKVGGNMLGVVLNNINISQDSYYYYYSGYYYDYYYKRSEDSAEKADQEEPKSGDEPAKVEIKPKY